MTRERVHQVHAIEERTLSANQARSGAHRMKWQVSGEEGSGEAEATDGTTRQQPIPRRAGPSLTCGKDSLVELHAMEIRTFYMELALGSAPS